MASYFVASHARLAGTHAVHDRSCCPPGTFPRHGAEYLGEFLDAAQALAVARLRYAAVTPCACCARATATSHHPARTPVRS
jgi:hypothetical protein